MTFDEFYEDNKERLTTHMTQSKLRVAFEAGVEEGLKQAETEELDKLKNGEN